MSEDLRDQLRHLDPMPPRVPTQEPTTKSSREMLEHIMSTPTVERPQTPPRRRVWYAVATAALAGIIAVVAVTVFNNGESGPDVVAGPPLELSLGEGPGMASCLAVNADILRDMPIAFEATAVSVDGEQVGLDVIRWYAGGDAAQVALTAPGGMQALIGGIDFEVGGHYLVAALDGVVNYCGYTDVYSPELAAVYAEAFGA